MELNTKEKLLDIAIDLFSKKGYDGVSIRDITRGVGIKESSLYNHFKSKDDLLITVYEMFLNAVGKESFNVDMIEEGLNQMSLCEFLEYQLSILRKQTTPKMAKIWKIIYMEQFKDERARDFVINFIMKMPEVFYKETFSIAHRKNMIKSKNIDMLSMVYQYSALMINIEQFLRENEDLTPLFKKRMDLIKFVCEGD